MTVLVTTGIASAYASYSWGVRVSGSTFAPGADWPTGGANWGTSLAEQADASAAGFPTYLGGYLMAFPVDFTYSGTGPIYINVTYSNGAQVISSNAFVVNVCPGESSCVLQKNECSE